MGKNWIKFKEFSKRDKIFRIIIMIITLGIFISSLVYLIHFIAIGNTEKRWFNCVGCMFIYILPYIYELIFRRRISNLILFSYTFYAFLSGLLGSVVGLYGKIVWYDIFIHTLAGYIFALLGLLIISRIFDYKKLNPWFIAIFALLTTLCAEYIWEIMEWASDNIIGLKSQGGPIPGYKAPLVTDTMEDMLCNLSGGILFCIQFLIGRFTKFSFGIKFYEQELCYKRFVKENYQKQSEVESNQKAEPNEEKEKSIDETSGIDNEDGI